jgi:hypothetical protein
MLIDHRIRAGADMDGLLFDPVRTRGLARPFLLMKADPGANVAAFWSKLRGPRYAVDFKGARHFAFSDLVTFVPALMRANPTAGKAIRELVGTLDGGPTLAAERRYLQAFFDRFLRETPEPLLKRTPGPFAGVRLTVDR